MLTVVVFVGGCAMTRAIVDTMSAKPLSAALFHQQSTTETQCVPCHTGAAGAPEVPHPQYESCAGCHLIE